MTVPQAAAEARRLSKTGEVLVYKMAGSHPKLKAGSFTSYSVIIDNMTYQGSSFDECFDKIYAAKGITK